MVANGDLAGTATACLGAFQVLLKGALRVAVWIRASTLFNGSEARSAAVGCWDGGGKSGKSGHHSLSSQSEISY